jgi:hypothetical protein
MKVFVGDIVKNEVVKAGKSKAQIASDIKISRQHLNNILGDDHMELEYVLGIGKSIRYDFSQDIAEINRHTINEPMPNYGDHTNAQLREDLLDLQKKYIALQTDHIKLLNELRAYERANN